MSRQARAQRSLLPLELEHNAGVTQIRSYQGLRPPLPLTLLSVSAIQQPGSLGCIFRFLCVHEYADARARKHDQMTGHLYSGRIICRRWWPTRSRRMSGVPAKPSLPRSAISDSPAPSCVQVTTKAPLQRRHFPSDAPPPGLSRGQAIVQDDTRRRDRRIGCAHHDRRAHRAACALRTLGGPISALGSKMACHVVVCSIAPSEFPAWKYG